MVGYSASDIYLRDMAATSSAWKIKPFIEGKPIPYKAVWSEEQFSVIANGHIPMDMDDKWFVYFEEPCLYLHRSWTGQPAYKVTISRTSKAYEARTAESAMTFTQNQEEDSAYQAELLDFLISNLLLGENKRFPLPPNAKAPSPSGAFQHIISGTAYAEKPAKIRKPWWQFWR